MKNIFFAKALRHSVLMLMVLLVFTVLSTAGGFALQENSADDPYAGLIRTPRKLTMNWEGTRQKITWTQQGTFTGHQVEWADNEAFENSESFRTSLGYFRPKNLKEGSTYCFRVRAYRNEDGRRKYGKWSSTFRFTYHKMTVKDGITYIDGIMIANKSYSLPSGYGNGMKSSASEAFNQMKKDAASLGLKLWNQSGYRSYSTQNTIYNNYIRNHGMAAAAISSARPGYSEHQTGYALDMNTITAAFADTKEGKWAMANCWKYGYILRYPYGKSDITGYKYEPWHIRYVGKELAAKLYNDGDWITLEEYFGIDSVYRD